MKISIALVLCGLSALACAQNSLKTFTSPDGLFRFQSSSVLVNCLPEHTVANSVVSGPSKGSQLAGASAPGSCMSQGSICSGPGSDGDALVCMAYPNEEFKNKPSFVAATFFVSEIKPAKTEILCLKGSPDWLVISTRGETTTINHIEFKTFEVGDNWMGGGQSGPVYRTFHNAKCYELGIQTVTSRAEYDPGTVKEFTKKDASEVEGSLKQALNSFLFLK